MILDTRSGRNGGPGLYLLYKLVFDLSFEDFVVTSSLWTAIECLRSVSFVWRRTSPVELRFDWVFVSENYLMMKIHHLNGINIRCSTTRGRSMNSLESRLKNHVISNYLSYQQLIVLTRVIPLHGLSVS